MTEQPGATLPDADLEPSEGKSAEEHVSSLLYPKVIKDFEAHMETYGESPDCPRVLSGMA